jgi:hypothetical protein
VNLYCLGGEKPTEKERALLANLGLTRRVQFKQICADVDILYGYSTSAALVIPALEEGFGFANARGVQPGRASDRLRG